jgi:hypothetical protein
VKQMLLLQHWLLFVSKQPKTTLTLELSVHIFGFRTPLRVEGQMPVSAVVQEVNPSSCGFFGM